jgi:hypothetical protein
MFWLGVTVGFVLGALALGAFLYLFDRMAAYGSTRAPSDEIEVAPAPGSVGH